jgi:hypothetical protein
VKTKEPAAPPGPWEIGQAVEILRSAGFQVLVNTRIKLCTVAEAAAALSVHPDWVKTHLDRFPGAVRLPGGHLRIPVDDILSFLKNSPL